MPDDNAKIRLRTQVSATIRKYNMISMRNRVVLGLSGGADSMCLLHVLLWLRCKYDLAILCAHVNHGIRERAALDEAFVKAACSALDVPLKIYHVDAKAHATTNKLSLEAAARALRYQCLTDCGDQGGNAYKIATAHNKGDVAETVLMNFLRGAGSHGLRGVRPVLGSVIRPLIDVRRADIEAFCAESGIEYVQDETNFQNNHTRNKIRNQLIPHIVSEFNPNILDVLATNATLHSDEHDFMHLHEQAALQSCLLSDSNNPLQIKLDTEKLATLHIAIARRVVRAAIGRLIDPRGISYTHTDTVLRIAFGISGKSVNIGGGIVAEKIYTTLRINAKAEPTPQGFSYDLTPDATTYIPQAGLHILISPNIPQSLPQNAVTKAFNLQVAPSGVALKLKLRTKLSGDKIFLHGIGGSQKLKNYFINNKVPREERAQTPLLAHGSEVLWIMDARGLTSDKHAPTSTGVTTYATIWRSH